VASRRVAYAAGSPPRSCLASPPSSAACPPLLPALQVATSPSTALQLYADDVAELGAPAPVSTTIAGLADHWDRSGAAWVAAAQAAAAAAASNGVAGPNADPAAPASPSRIIVVANAGGETTAATAPSGAARVETAPQSGPASVGAASHHHSFAARGTNAFAAAQYGSTFAHSIAHHTRLLVGREGRLYVRNKALIMAKLMQSVVMAAVFGAFGWRVLVAVLVAMRVQLSERAPLRL
jgi:hypothetical protein